MNNEWYLKTLRRVQELLDITPDLETPEYYELIELNEQLDEYESQEFKT